MYIVSEKMFKYKPQHDKTNKVSESWAKTQISLVWSVFTVHSVGNYGPVDS